jgi:hypothetical protein
MKILHTPTHHRTPKQPLNSKYKSCSSLAVVQSPALRDVNSPSRFEVLLEFLQFGWRRERASLVRCDCGREDIMPARLQQHGQPSNSSFRAWTNTYVCHQFIHAPMYSGRKITASLVNVTVRGEKR